MRKALYAGSFDPPTLGHLWVARTGLAMCDQLIVAVGHNPDKHSLFTPEERVDLFQRALADTDDGAPLVNVISYTGKLTVDLARELGASIMVRGIRGHDDLDHEATQRQVNADLAPDIVTVFLMPPREITHVSSTFVRGVLGVEGWEKAAARCVPPVVLDALHLRSAGPRDA